MLRVIAIVTLMGLIYWSLSSLWGILAMALLCAVGYIINADKQGSSVDHFYAGCFLVTLGGGVAFLIRQFT